MLDVDRGIFEVNLDGRLIGKSTGLGGKKWRAALGLYFNGVICHVEIEE